MKFSDKVKYVRMKLELSEESLARDLGVSYSTVSQWERENREPQLATLGKFYNFCEKNEIRFESEGNK